MSNKTYKYKPLAENEIRLIQFRRTSQCSSISTLVECKLYHRSLDSTVEYNALSYAWGDATVTELIALDGINFHVTKNLAAALKVFSESEQTVSSPLWVDALCINQSDITERSIQVLKMTEIYQRAKEVIVWLGPCSLAVEVALMKLSGLQQILEPAITELVRNTGKAPWRDVLSVSLEQLRNYMDPNASGGSQFWSGLDDLYDLPWWKRTWILQEVASATKFRFICGTLSFDVGFMRTADHCIRAVSRDPKSASLEFVSTFKMRHIFRVIGFKDACQVDGRLLNLLSLGRLGGATDPRDKIYAFLGLATDVEDGSLAPNYHFSQWRIFTQVAIWYILKYNNLDIFSHCFPNNLGSDNLPSWVPDWSLPILPSGFQKATQSNGRLVNSYHASKDNLVYQPRETMEIFGQAYLRTNGINMGHIKHLSTCVEDEVGTEVQRSWMPLNKSEIYKWTGETLDMAFRRTIVGDLCPTTGSRGFAYDSEWPKNGNFLSPAVGALGITQNRRLAHTENGLIGLVPRQTQVGDSVFILLSGSVVYVLRSTEEKRYALIGEAYFHGMMDGEAIEKLQQGEFKLERIILE